MESSLRVTRRHAGSHRDDQDHQLCTEVLRELRGPLFTTWIPVTEAMYLLEFCVTAQGALLEMIERRASAGNVRSHRGPVAQIVAQLAHGIHPRLIRASEAADHLAQADPGFGIT